MNIVSCKFIYDRWILMMIYRLLEGEFLIATATNINLHL